MPIKLDCSSKILKVKALPGVSFTRDRDFLAKIPGRIPRYGIDPVTGRDSFQYWEIPRESLGLLIEQYDEAIVATDIAKKAIEEYKYKTIPIEDLPRETLRVEPHDGKTLKPYQINYITTNFNKKAILSSFCTGAGKSLSSILRTANIGFSNLLIVGPKKLRLNWRTEVRETLGKELLIYWGKTKDQRLKLREKIKDYNIFYTNYESLKEFMEVAPRFDHIIVDEIHIVCTPETQNNKALYKVLRDCQSAGGHIQGLSATPMRLKIEDLWGVLRLLDPDFAGSKKAFLDQYQLVLATMPVRKNGRTFYVPIKVTSKNEEHLRNKLKSIMIRVKKDQVVDFQDEIELIDVELTLRQSSYYEECITNLRIELSDRTLDTSNALARMTRLLQISEGMFNLDSKFRDSGKLDYLKEELGSESEKVVIWSRFEPITREIKNLFPNKTVVYSGAVSDGLKDLAVFAFQGVTNKQDEEEFFRLKKYHPDFPFNPGEAQFFVGTHSLKSGIGINLQKAHKCIFSSYDWNANIIYQARDRISRLGQTEDTETYFLVAQETIEKKALRLILSNHERSLNILDGGYNSTNKDLQLTRELMKLLC